MKKGGKAPWVTERNLRNNPAKKGEESNFWTGVNIKYSGIHQWIAKKMGSASSCEDCGLKEIPKDRKRYFNWANKSKKYLRDISDWKSLCIPCHRQFDKKAPRYCFCGRNYHAKNLCLPHYKKKLRGTLVYE